MVAMEGAAGDTEHGRETAAPPACCLTPSFLRRKMGVISPWPEWPSRLEHVLCTRRLHV